MWCYVMWCHFMLSGTTQQYEVLLRTTQYYASTTILQSTTPVLQSTTPYYKVLRQYYSVLQSTTRVLLRTTKYYASTTPYYKVLESTTPVLQSTTPVLQSTTPVLLSTTKYYSVLQSTTPVLLWTTPVLQSTSRVLLRTTKYYEHNSVLLQYYKVLLQYYKVLRQYYSVLQSTNPVLQSTNPVLQSTTKYYSSTTKYYASTTLYYSVLQSTTPVLLCTTKYYASTTLYYKVLLQYYSVLQSTTPVLQSITPVLQSTTPSSEPAAKSDTWASPNIAPVKQNDSHAWSWCHMKRHLQCAEQQVSPSNLTKYCACHTEWLACLIVVTYETSFTMRGATGVTIQPHQILRLPHRMTRMLDRRHIWNVIYNARSNRCHHPTSPNTAPATQNDSHAWSSSHMKRHLQCAEQQVSPSNLTKYCACHTEWLACLIVVTYETSFTMRGATGVTIQPPQILHLPRKMTLQDFKENLQKQVKRHFQCGADPTMIRPWSEHDPTIIRPWNRQSATRLATEVTFRPHHEHFLL